MNKRHFIYSLLMILLLIVAFTGWFATDYLDNQARQEIISEGRASALTLSIYVYSTLTNTEGAVKSLAGSPWIAPALLSKGNQDIEHANSALDRYNSALKTSVSYLMDANGITVASSNRKDPDSFVGKSYRFRPYFQEAAKGQPYHYFALGITSVKRGFYASYPVQNSLGKVLGVVTMKNDLDDMGIFFRKYPFCFLISPDGIIFLSSKPEMVLKSFWPLDKTAQEKLIASRQFGNKLFEAVTEKEIADGTEVTLEGKNYFVSRKVIGSDGWSIVVLTTTHRVWIYKLIGILTTIFVCFLMMVFSGILYLTDRSQKAIRQSEESKHLLLHAAGEGIFGVDTSGQITFINPAALRMLGFTEEETLGQSAHALIHHSHKDGSNYPVEDCPIYASYAKATEIHMTDEVLWRKDGSYFHVDYFSTPITKDGNIMGAVVTFKDITERKLAEAYGEMDREIMQILNETGTMHDSIQSVLTALNTRTGFDAVGIRLRDGDDFPYFAQNGFSNDFLLTENTLTERGADGGLCRDEDGNVSLECTCGLVISGKTDPSNPLFTKGGSVWTNDSFPLLDLSSDQDPRLNPRNKCIHQGYASVALVPIRNKNSIIGLIQFNDHRKNCFSLASIEQFEKIAANIGEALLRKYAEDALQKSEERYRVLVENASDMIFRTDLNGYFTYVNSAVIHVTGYEKEELIGKQYTMLIRSDMRDNALKYFGRQLVKGLQNTYSEYPIITKDGQRLCFGQNTQLIVKDGNFTGFQVMSRDITELRRLEEKVRFEQQRFRAFVEHSSDMIVLVNLEGVIMYVNPAIENILGFKPEERIGAKGFEIIHPDDIKALADVFNTLSRDTNSPIIKGELRLRHKDGSWRTLEAVGSNQINNNVVEYIIINYRDITERKKAEDALKESEQKYRELSIIDDLTQIYNSRHFYAQLEREIERSNRYGQPLTLLLLDLDNFKTFNDTYGHVEGDHVLSRVGHVVKRCLRETDSAYRYGGEEFTIMLPMTKSEEGIVTAKRIQTKLRKEVFSPVLGQEIYMTVSIGLAQYKPKEEIRAFVSRVDQLMYQAKRNGRDRICPES